MAKPPKVKLLKGYTYSRPVGWPQANLRRAIDAYRLLDKRDSFLVVTTIAQALLRHMHDLNDLIEEQSTHLAKEPRGAAEEMAHGLDV